MGLAGDLGKAFLEGVVEGVVDGVQEAQRKQERQNQLNAMKEFAEKESEIQEAANNGDLEAIQILASVYFKQGDAEKATYYAGKGAQVDDETCLYVLGSLAYQREDYKSAENFFLRSIRVNGDEPSAVALGEMYFSAEDYQKAEHFYRIAFRRNNSNNYVAFAIACCMLYNENNNFNEIRELLKVASWSSNPSISGQAQELMGVVDEKQRVAQRQATQQQNGCFITTAVCDNFGKPDDCYELTAFRKFRDGWLKFQNDGQKLIEEYYRTAPSIVDKINALPNAKFIYQEIWDNYLSKCLSYIESRDYYSCKNLYANMVKDLKAKFNV